jgi:hypothetical protein
MADVLAAQGIVNTMQRQVGSSLTNVAAMLPPPPQILTNEEQPENRPGFKLLDEIKEYGKKSYESIQQVGFILQSQLNLAEEKERRERDQASELAKEQARLGGNTRGDGNGVNTGEDETSSMSLDKMKDFLTLGLGTTLLSGAALKSAGAMLGTKLVKGGLYGALAAVAGPPLINYLNNEFELDLTEQGKKDIANSLTGAAVGFGVAGIPGAVIGATTPYIARVAKFISGNLDASKVSDKDFAIAGIGTAAAGMFTAGKVGALLAGSKIGAVATFGTALASLPVLIGIGGAIALGAGAMFITKKIDEYQEMTLEKLANTTEKLSKQMGEWAAKEEESLLEKMGIRLGKLSAIGEASVATDEAQEQLKQKGVEKFTADTAMQTKLLALGDTLIGYSDQALRDIMSDRTKSRNFFNTIESLKSIASQGGFGESSKDIFEKMSAFSDRIQNFAKAEVKAGNTGGAIQDIALNKEGFGGDQLEKAKDLQNDLQKAQIRQANAQEALMYAKMARETEDKEQQKTLAGKIADLGFNTDIERAESDAQKELASANAKAAFAQKQLDKLGTTMGLQFDFKDVQKLYKDDPEGLKALIERSINNQGQAFLQEQAKANAVKEQPGTNIAVDAKKTDASVTSIKRESNNYQLNSDTDPIALRLGMAT